MKGPFEINEHDFTQVIRKVMDEHFADLSRDIFSSSPILGYLNHKTKSANRGSKSRSSFANLYALYVVVEDYIQQGYFDGKAGSPYAEYNGAQFSDLFRRQRELPFGSKLQNHSLNSRLNNEFRKFYPNVGKQPIVRDVTTTRYWVQEDLLLVEIRDRTGADLVCNIAQAIMDIIDAYVKSKRVAFEKFLTTCQALAELGSENPQIAIEFIREQLAPSADARVFEIVSYAILKAKYGHPDQRLKNPLD